MSMFSDLKYRFRAIFQRETVERELDRGASVSLRTSSREVHEGRDAAGRGDPPGAPRDGRRRAAQGGMPDARGLSMLETTLQDLRFASPAAPQERRLRSGGRDLAGARDRRQHRHLHAPRRVLFRMLPVAEPTPLHFVQRHQPEGSATGFAYNEFRRFRQQNPVFSDVAAYSQRPIQRAHRRAAVEPTAEGQLVSGSFFRLLASTPFVGRTIGPEDDREPERAPCGGPRLQLLEAPFRDGAVSDRPVDIHRRNIVHGYRGRPAGVLRAGGRKSGRPVRSSDDAADGDARRRKLAR